jgi:hypothetical protein
MSRIVIVILIYRRYKPRDRMDLRASGWSVVGTGSGSCGSENVECSGYFTR